MDTLAHLKSLLDEMDTDEIVAAEAYLLNIMQRRTPSVRTEPALARLDRRADEFRRSVERRWRDAFAASARGRCAISGLGGGGGAGFDFQGYAHGKLSFTYSEAGAAVEESLRFVAGYEIETVDRLELSQDGTKLLYKQAVKSGGREVSREEGFPCNSRNRWIDTADRDVK